MENQQTYSPGGMGCLVALAERCASEGQMNLNKLLEAVVYAETRCAGWRYRPEVTRETMQQELAEAIRQITERHLAPELIAALKAGLEALAANRGSDLLAEEAPDVFVCRMCGHAVLGALPDHPVASRLPGLPRANPSSGDRSAARAGRRPQVRSEEP